jgi:hypothetical protein
MFNYMLAKIRRGGSLISPDGRFVDLRTPDQIRSDKEAEIQAVKDARAFYVQALTGLCGMTYRTNPPIQYTKTFTKLQYYTGRDDPRVTTGAMRADGIPGFFCGITDDMKPAQVTSDNYPTSRPLVRSVQKEVPGPLVKTCTHFTFPDGAYGFTATGTAKYAKSETLSSSDGYRTGKIQGSGGIYDGVRYDLAGAFPDDSVSYTVDIPYTLDRVRMRVHPGNSSGNTNYIYDEWYLKYALDACTAWQTPRPDPNPHPETDMQRVYNAIDYRLLEAQTYRNMDWFWNNNSVANYGLNLKGYGDQFMTGDAIYYFSDLGVGMAIYDAGISWPPWYDGSYLPPPYGRFSITGGRHYHKSYLRDTSGRKLSGNFYVTRTGVPGQSWMEFGVFIADGQAYDCAAKWEYAIPCAPFCNHIFRPSSRGPLYDYDMIYTDSYGVYTSENSLRVNQSCTVYSGVIPPYQQHMQLIPFVTQYSNGHLAPISGMSRAFFCVPNETSVFIPGGEDFTSTESTLLGTIVPNAHGAIEYLRSSTAYTVDVLKFTDALGSVSFPIYRSAEKLLSGNIFSVDIELARAAYKLPPAFVSGGYVFDQYLWGGSYRLVNPFYSFAQHVPTPTLVTPSIANREITLDLPQGWIAYLSKRYRNGNAADAFQHVGEGASGSAFTQYYENFLSGETSQYLTLTNVANIAGSSPYCGLVSPGAIELPRPTNGIVKIPPQYVGDWFLQIVDTYYCVMRETAITL